MVLAILRFPLQKAIQLCFRMLAINLSIWESILTVISNINKVKTIKLPPRNYLLDEVSIYAITSNNPRTMPQSKPRVPSNEEIRIPQAVAPTLANPLDLLYYNFGKRPKQLAALRRLQREDYYRQKLEEGKQ